MGREFASGDMDDLGGLDAAEVERALAQAQEPDVASLPSFKRLPPHRRADQRRAESAGDPPPQAEPMPPQRAMRVPPPTRTRVPEPTWLRAPAPRRVSEPLHLTEAMRLAAAMPPAHRRQRRSWRAIALPLLGAALGAVATLALSDAPPQSGTIVVTKYLTMLPLATPAAAPPQIIYVDRWRIVTPEPRLLQPYEVLPPAMPAAPPPQIVMIERASATVSPRQVVERKRPLRAETTARAPEPRPEQHDVAKELEQWLSGASDRQ